MSLARGLEEQLAIVQRVIEQIEEYIDKQKRYYSFRKYHLHFLQQILRKLRELETLLLTE